ICTTNLRLRKAACSTAYTLRAEQRSKFECRNPKQARIPNNQTSYFPSISAFGLRISDLDLASVAGLAPARDRLEGPVARSTLHSRTLGKSSKSQTPSTKEAPKPK